MIDPSSYQLVYINKYGKYKHVNFLDNVPFFIKEPSFVVAIINKNSTYTLSVDDSFQLMPQEFLVMKGIVQIINHNNINNFTEHREFKISHGGLLIVN